MHRTMESYSPSPLLWWGACDQQFFWGSLEVLQRATIFLCQHMFVGLCFIFGESQCLSAKMATPFVSMILACSTCSFRRFTIFFLLCIIILDFVLHCCKCIGWLGVTLQVNWVGEANFKGSIHPQLLCIHLGCESWWPLFCVLSGIVL